MKLYNILKRIFGTEAQEAIGVSVEVEKKPNLVEEPKSLSPSINYTANEETIELILTWLFENKIENICFGEVLYNLGFMDCLSSKGIKHNDDPFLFSKISIPISSPYRDKEYLGAINCHFDLGDSKYDFTIIFYRNAIMKLEESKNRYSYHEDFTTSGGIIVHPKDKENPDTLLTNEYVSKLAQKYIATIDENDNIVFKLILHDEQEEATCSYRKDEKDYYQIDSAKGSSFMNKPGQFIPFSYSLYKKNGGNNKINVYVEYNGKKVMLDLYKPYNLSDNFFDEKNTLHGIACDIDNGLPIYTWSYSNEFNKYVLQYTSSIYGTILRIDVPYFPENHQYKRENDIKNITDKFVIMDALRSIFCDFERDVACRVYRYPNYQSIKISTEDNGVKQLDLVYQNDEENNERRVIITNNENKLVRSCVAKNVKLENNMTSRVIEVTDGTNKVVLLVDGKSIKEINDETRLFLLLLDTFPINVNIDWVWESICNLSFRDIPNNYAKVQLVFYKDGKLIDKREFQNNLFNKERGPVRSKTPIDRA